MAQPRQTIEGRPMTEDSEIHPEFAKMLRNLNWHNLIMPDGTSFRFPSKEIALAHKLAYERSCFLIGYIILMWGLIEDDIVRSINDTRQNGPAHARQSKISLTPELIIDEPRRELKDKVNRWANMLKLTFFDAKDWQKRSEQMRTHLNEMARLRHDFAHGPITVEGDAIVDGQATIRIGVLAANPKNYCGYGTNLPNGNRVFSIS